MVEAYASVGEERVRARFLSASWGVDHPPANFFFLTFNLLKVHGL